MCRVGIWRSPGSAMWFSFPSPSADDLGRMYSYFYKDQAPLRPTSPRVQHQLRYLEQTVLQRKHRNFPRVANIVSIGCADGVLEGLLSKPGMNITCFEPGFPHAFRDTRSRIAASGANVTMIGSLWDAARAPRDIDLFMSSHVLEHLVDICSFLQELYDHMRPGGSVFTEIPLYSEMELAQYSKTGTLHLNFFTPPGFMTAMERVGFKVEQLTTYPNTYSGMAANGKVLDAVFERPLPLTDKHMRNGLVWT
jgi:2-polyprenyl-3-methyl-5-hydroxy-6-metoxy-1,4-benzoquinol methylase